MASTLMEFGSRFGTILTSHFSMLGWSTSVLIRQFNPSVKAVCFHKDSIPQKKKEVKRIS